MNRDQVCSQQIHCLSCPLSVGRTGKQCDKLTESEVKMIIRYPENLCCICGAEIPSGRMICPACGATEATMFEKCESVPIPGEPEFKVDDTIEQAFREGYTKGFEEGSKHSCIIKQDNERLKRENAFLRGRLESRFEEDDEE